MSPDNIVNYFTAIGSLSIVCACETTMFMMIPRLVIVENDTDV